MGDRDRAEGNLAHSVGVHEDEKRNPMSRPTAGERLWPWGELLTRVAGHGAFGAADDATVDRPGGWDIGGLVPHASRSGAHGAARALRHGRAGRVLALHA